LEGIRFGNRAFDTGDVDTSLPGVEVLPLEERHLGRTEAVMIGERKERAIPLARDDRKEPAHLVLGEEGNLRERCGVLAGLHRPTVYVFCRIKARRGEIHTGAPGS